MKKLLAHAVWLFCILALVDSCSLAYGQDDSTNSGPQGDALPREALPHLVMVSDGSGIMVPWIDFPFEEYDRLLHRQKLENQTYLLKKLILEGTVESTHCRVKSNLQVQVLEDGRQVIPIKMNRAIVTGQPKSKTQVFIRRDAEFGGHELLIVDAKKGDQLEVEFEAFVPVDKVGPKTYFKLATPRVAVGEMTLKIPSADTQLSGPEGAYVTRVTDSTEQGRDQDDNNVEDKKSSTFRIAGLPSDVDLFWSETEQTTTQQLIFDVSGDIDVQVDDLGGITCDAQLNIISFDQPIERELTIQLPANTRLEDAETEFRDYEITELEAEGDRREVLIAFREPSRRPAPIQLRVKAEKELEEFELAGFVVYGATNQSGQVTVYSEGNRQLRPLMGEFARRISNPEANRFAHATYRYAKPNQIRLLILRQTPELAVTPMYSVSVGETRAVLNAVFQCTKRGGNPPEIQFDLGPWQFQNLGLDPDNVVQSVDELQDSSARSINIKLQDPPDRFEVSFTATLPFPETLPLFDAGEGSALSERREPNLVLELPFVTNAKSVRQSTLAISNGSTVALAVGDATGFTETTLPPRLADELESDTNPTCYRTKVAGARPSLPLFARRLQGAIDVKNDIEIVGIDTDSITVRQEMKWQVRNVPLQAALLIMSRELADKTKGNVQVEVNGNSVVTGPVPSFPDFVTGNSIIKVELEPGMSAFDMTVTYQWSRWDEDGLPTDISDLEFLDLDLVAPKKPLSPSDQTLEVETHLRKTRLANYEFELDYSIPIDSPWDSSLNVTSPNREIEAFVAPSSVAVLSVPLRKRPVRESVVATSLKKVVEQAWFQTWYTNSKRMDRAVFRVQGGDDSVRIVRDKKFPKLIVRVDGERGDYRFDGDSAIVVTLDVAAPSHVIELQYSEDSREPPGALETLIPRVEGADIYDQWYWHIVMPRNECLVTWPRSLTRAHEWDWSVLIPRRKPELNLSQLEAWIGATRTQAKVHAGSREYLFGAMGQTNRLTVRTTMLPTYFIAVAGSIFVMGMLLIYSKRRVLVLALVASLIMLLVFLHPSYASIAGQIAVFGVLLVAVTRLLMWLIRNTGRPATPSSAVEVAAFPQLSKRGSSVAEQVTALLTGSSQFRSGE